MNIVDSEAAPGRSVADLTRDALGEFSASERKVARALLAAYPVAGLETVAQLAARASVSPPTVVRFVARLGFEGYPAFQRSLMREVHERMGSPLEQYAAKPEVPEGRDLLSYVSSALSGILSASFAEVPQSELTEAVDLLCDRRLEVHLVGGRFSHLLAGYLAAHLQLLRSGVSDVPQDQFSRFALVADAGRSHALVAFDYRRYDPDTVRLARLFSKAGGKVILLTDQWMSPAADFADAVLPSRVESPSPFDSLVPALALVETLITAVTERLGDRGRGRIELFERQRADLDDDGRDRS